MSDHEISITIQTYAKDAIDQLSKISGQLSKLQGSVTKMSGTLGRIETSLSGIANSMNGVGSAAQGMKKQIDAVDAKPIVSVEKNLKGVKTGADAAQEAFQRLDAGKALPVDKALEFSNLMHNISAEMLMNKGGTQSQFDPTLLFGKVNLQDTKFALPERSILGLNEVAEMRDRIINQADAYRSSLRGMTGEQVLPEGAAKNLGRYLSTLQSFKPGEQISSWKELGEMLRLGTTEQGGQLSMFTNMFAQMQTASQGLKSGIDAETDSLDRMVDAENRAVDASRERASAETQAGLQRASDERQMNLFGSMWKNRSQNFDNSIGQTMGLFSTRDANRTAKALDDSYAQVKQFFAKQNAETKSAGETLRTAVGDMYNGAGEEAQSAGSRLGNIVKSVNERFEGYLREHTTAFDPMMDWMDDLGAQFDAKLDFVKTKIHGAYEKFATLNDVSGTSGSNGQNLGYYDSIKLQQLTNQLRVLEIAKKNATNPADVQALDAEIRQLQSDVASLTSGADSAGMANGSRFSGISNMASGIRSNITSLKAEWSDMSTALKTAFDGLPSYVQKPLAAVGSLAKKAASGVKDAFIKAGSAAGRGFANLVTAPFRMVKNSFENDIKGIQDKFAGIGKSIRSTISMAWRLLLRQIIRSIFSSISEGVQALAQYSSAFNATMSSLKSSLLTMRNALTVAFAPVLDAIAPVFDAIISKVVSAANALGRFLSALTGKGFAIQAKRVSTSFAAASSSASGASNGASDLADSTKDAADAAEEYKNTLLGFDKIEKLAEQSDSSGSGSGSGSGGGSGSSGSSSPSVYDMFETVAVDGESKALAEQFREALETADFTDIGEAFGEKVTDVLASIDWAKYQEKAYKIGKGIATFTNGAIAGTDWNVVGESVAGSVNTVIELFYGYFSHMDFGKLGAAIGTGIASAIHNINWAHAGYNLGKAIQGLFDFMLNLVEHVDWYEFGSKIAEFFNNAFRQIKPKNIAKLVSDILIGAMDLIRGFIETADASKITNSIETFIKNIKWKDIAKTAAALAVASLRFLFADIIAELKKHKFAWSLLTTLVPGLEGFSQFGTIGAILGENLLGNTGSVTVGVNLEEGDVDEDAKKALDSEGKTGTHTTKSTLTKGTWDKEAAKIEELTAKSGRVATSTSSLISSVFKGTFNKDAWEAANKKGTTSSVLSQSVVAGRWDGNAWTAAKMVASTTSRIVSQAVSKGSWNNDAWSASNKASGTVTRTLNVKVLSNAIGKGASLANAILKAANLKADGGVFRGGKWMPIPAAANGGSFNSGQLFIAREAGPELVSNVGHHTTVMNNDQIVASVSKGVYNAVLAAMGSNQQSVNVVIQGDADRFLRVLKEKSDNTMRATGQPIFKV